MALEKAMFIGKPMDLFTQYPAEWAYVWLIFQTYWLIKMGRQTWAILGFAASHGCFLWFMLAFRADMTPLYGWHGRTSDNAMSSFGLIFLAWAALAVIYLTRVLLLPRKRPSAPLRSNRKHAGTQNLPR